MTVRRSDDGAILLDGECGVEDAEALLQMLLAVPQAPLDWTAATHLHGAVLQILLAAAATPAGPCGDAWLRQWLPHPAAG